MILVVDDHAVLAHGLQRLLQMSGFEAAYVTSGQEALEFVRGERPDLIILDQNMPGMSGLEFLQHLRHEPGRQDVCVLIASAASDPAVEEQALALGAVGYVQKGGRAWNDVAVLVRQYLCTPAKTVASGAIENQSMSATDPA